MVEFVLASGGPILLPAVRSCAHRDASRFWILPLIDPSEECSHTGEGRWLDSKQRGWPHVRA
jgi:hypothetical protein